MELFLDNDIILKLSAINSLNKIETIFNVSPDFVFILPTASAYIRNSKKVKEKYSSEVINNALEAINNYSVIPDEYIDQPKFIQLSGIDKIDSGEKILFSITTASNDFLILTGDKNSIKAISSHPGIDNIRHYLKNKIVCLERIVLTFLETINFDSLVQQIIDSDFCGDKTIKIIFEQTNLNAENVQEGLRSYFADLKYNAGSLLFENF